MESGSRIVTEQEVRQATGDERRGWVEAAFQEFNDSFMKMEAVRTATSDDISRAGGFHKVLPMKVVWTQKPEKKKCRAVVCGNFEEPDPTQQVWTAQAECSSVMAGLRLAQLKHWHIGKLDVKGAFMHAPLPEDMHVLVRPPKSWVRLGLIPEGTIWVLRKAVYGLRISPRAWGTERDSRIRQVTWTAEGKKYFLQQCTTDSQVWRIVESRGSSVEVVTLGLLICYVDDLLLLCPQGAMRAGLERALTENTAWEITKVDLIPGVPFTFLGLEIERKQNNDIRIHQTAFTKALLARYGFDLLTRPSFAVQAAHPAEEDDPPTPEELKTLQRYCGEFNWLATRTRPDLSYYTSLAAQAVTKKAAWTLALCKKVVRYLASTYDQGLTFSWLPHVGSEGLISWSDASFAGLSTRNQTGVVIVWEGAIILARSSRQASTALSTCEAEVAAASTSFQVVEGLKVLLTEWDVDVGVPILLVDNKSALRISELGATWRTRYFAIRAARLAEESAAGTISLRYCPTGDMVADGLTKLAAITVMENLRKACDGILPPIPDITQSLRESTDKKTWWGQGLSVEFAKASLARLKSVLATCSTGQRSCAPVAAAASVTTPPPPPQLPPATPQTADLRAALLQDLLGAIGTAVTGVASSSVTATGSPPSA